MLHMYLITARLRCMEHDESRNWQQQFIDSFFFDCEKMMDLNHGIRSAAMRQRYLKDLFIQWRGLIAAYDEGIIKGDAVLATAVWRNLFKASDNIDFRVLAAVVSWMRATLRDLEKMEDADLVLFPKQIFRRSIKDELEAVDKPSPSLGRAPLPPKSANPATA
jgi:cytochrome b pre-mRNA-processing protein 3